VTSLSQTVAASGSQKEAESIPWAGTPSDHEHQVLDRWLTFDDEPNPFWWETLLMLMPTAACVSPVQAV
jgi:hypothetical protein